MKRKFRAGTIRRATNAVMTSMARSGLGPRNLHLLTVVGRTSGKPYTTPVWLVLDGDRRWLVAAYGVVQWVKNARAAGRVTLSRGRKTTDYVLDQVTGPEAGRVLKKYLKTAPVALPYFESGMTSSAEDFAAEAHEHPVFALEPAAHQGRAT